MQDKPKAGLSIGEIASGLRARKLDRTMKVTIDTRHDTLAKALAVVALAFRSNDQVATTKPKREAQKPAGARRGNGATKGAGRQAPGPKTTTRVAPARNATVRKPAATRPATSGTAVEPRNPTKAKASKPANVAPPGQSETIRAWARSQGLQVADAGRMSAAVIAAYSAQHS
jgi:hypothetical protein